MIESNRHDSLAAMKNSLGDKGRQAPAAPLGDAGLRVVQFVEKLDARLEREGYALECRRAVVKALYEIGQDSTQTSESAQGSSSPASIAADPGAAIAAIIRTLTGLRDGWADKNDANEAIENLRALRERLSSRPSELPCYGDASVSSGQPVGEVDAAVCAYRFLGDPDVRIEEAQQIEGPALWAVRKDGNCLNKAGK
ncbi:MAG TPA: hypothetical protein VGB55_16060, partial [Tepidisphaeraceae bacterium]